jgi:TetR/AcrR family transcriptional repressor of nem operon
MTQLAQPPRPRAPNQPAAVRREAILDAAIRVFAHCPYAAARTADIASEAGIAEGTIFRIFKTKRELYLAAVARSMGSIADTWQALTARTPHPAAALTALGRWYQEGVRTDPDPFHLRLRAIAEAEDEAVRTVLRDGYGALQQLVAQLIRRGQADGSFPASIDAEGAAWLFMGVGQVTDLAVQTGLELAVRPGAMGAMNRTFGRLLRPPRSESTPSSTA